jgi:hypothetical protein
MAKLALTETFESVPEEDVFKATDILGGSTVRAIEAGQAWLAAENERVQGAMEPK